MPPPPPMLCATMPCALSAEVAICEYCARVTDTLPPDGAKIACELPFVVLGACVAAGWVKVAALIAADVSPSRPPPPPTDCARMPHEPLPDAAMLPARVTFTLPPEALFTPAAARLAERMLLATSVMMPPPPPTDCATIPMARLPDVLMMPPISIVTAPPLPGVTPPVATTPPLGAAGTLNARVAPAFVPSGLVVVVVPGLPRQPLCPLLEGMLELVQPKAIRPPPAPMDWPI